jgi:pSer/pThr/pTyr-binding forkhead associated (FHA) protein
MQLRRAEAAWQAKRLDEAGQLLVAERLWEFLPAQRITAEVVVAFLERGLANVAAANLNAGWSDLDAAIRLAGESAGAIELRKRLIDATLAEVDRYLAAEDAAAARRLADDLARRGCDTPRVQIAAQIIRRVLAAGRLLRQGRCSDAEAELAAAVRLRPDLRALETRLGQCRVLLAERGEWIAAVNAAVASRDWLAALDACDRLLAAAPEDVAMQRVRNRAARHVATDPPIGARPAEGQPPTARAVPHLSPAFPATPRQNSPARGAEPVNWMDTPRAANCAHARSTPRPRGSAASAQHFDGRMYGASADQDMSSSNGPRLLAWADAVGGYLVCLGDQVILGQAAAGGAADIPILADLSRRHAVIRRDGESYAIVPLQRTLLDGRELVGPAPLAHGNVIELGNGVKFRFERPNPLSATAILQFVSHHRTRPKVDAIVLMAQTCIFGPTSSSHVVCRNLESDLILYRDGKNFACRANGVMEIDGNPQTGRGQVEPTSRIAFGQFALSLEPVESRAAGADQT